MQEPTSAVQDSLVTTAFSLGGYTVESNIACRRIAEHATQAGANAVVVKPAA
jgi:hypothetical protein